MFGLDDLQGFRAGGSGQDLEAILNGFSDGFQNTAVVINNQNSQILPLPMLGIQRMRVFDLRAIGLGVAYRAASSWRYGGSAVGPSPATVVRCMTRCWLALSQGRPRCSAQRLSHITRSPTRQ
jgi:hypothetical protein